MKRHEGLWKSRSLRRSLLGHDLALIVTGLGWVILLAWQVLLFFSAQRVRAEVEGREAWLVRAERFHEIVSVASSRIAGEFKEKLHPPSLPPELATELARVGLLVALPSEGSEIGEARKTWSSAARSLVAEIERQRGAGRDDDVALRFEACVRRIGELSKATGNLIRLVRADLRDRNVDLDEHWSYLFRLAAVLFGLVAVLTWMLARSKRHAQELAASKNAHQVSEGRLRTLLKMPQALLWSMDGSGRWSYLSRAARQVYGYDAAEMVGRPVADFVPPDRVREERELFERILRSDGTVMGELVHLRADGKRVTLLIEARAMRDESGRAIGTTGFAMDVTAVDRLRREQLHAERLQAIGTLAGGVAHDFNNLLGVIQCSCEFALEVLEENPAEASRSLEDVAAAASRAKQLTQQLLAFARRQNLQHSVWDLADLVRETEGFLARLMDTGITLKSELGCEEVPVRADRGQVEQVVVNLVMNARDALRDGGTITISVSRCTLTSADAAPLGLEPGHWATLEVRDDGEGMDEETQRRAFEPFFTTKEQGKGTGLGLASSHGIILGHGGSIQMTSAVGRGTTFRIHLPLAPADRPARESPVALAVDR